MCHHHHHHHHHHPHHHHRHHHPPRHHHHHHHHRRFKHAVLCLHSADGLSNIFHSMTASEGDVTECIQVDSNNESNQSINQSINPLHFYIQLKYKFLRSNKLPFTENLVAILLKCIHTNN